MQNIPAGWEDSANDAFFLASCAAMFLDPEGVEARSFFRESWPDDKTNQSPPASQDVCYYRIYTRDDPTVNWLYSELSLDGVAQIETVPILCSYIFYGPNAGKHASFLRTALFREVFTTCNGIEYPPPMRILRNSGIVPLLYPAQPVRLPELTSGVWRNRSDLTIHFNIHLETLTETDGIQVPPVISVIKE